MRSLVRSAPLLVLLLAGGARADTASEARFFDDLARHAFNRGDYAGALDAFLRVHAIVPSPRALYNAAVCADSAKNHEVAYASYRDYLGRDDPDEERRKDATQRLAALERKLAVVTLTTTPPGATIFVDRKELGGHGATPRDVVVAPGDHEIHFALEGYEDISVSVRGDTGAKSSADVRLVPRFGDLAVEVTPKTAALTFFRGDDPVEAKLDGGRVRLPVGSYRVVARAVGHTPVEARTVVKEGVAASVLLVAVPLPKPTGRLLVGSGEVAAEVHLDGKRVAVTPATLPGIGAGPHVVEVRAAGRPPFTRRIVVAEGKTQYVEAAFGGPSR